MAEGEIREGFLCPMCMEDLGTVAQLQSHFEVAHREQLDESPDVLVQLRGFIGKAKRKILGKEAENEFLQHQSGSTITSSSGAPGVPEKSLVGYDPSDWEPQELGMSRNWIQVLKQQRGNHSDRFVVETNKLIIRLDKLMSPDAPTEPNKRKAFEKNIVPWAPDSDVNICTSCGKSFTITRRRHHCRLCGTIICNKCSQFLPYGLAKKLTNPAYKYEGEGFHRSSSNSSLNSMMSAEGELHIRTCPQCRTMLEKRDQQMEQRSSRPIITQLYEKLRSYIEQTEEILPKFYEMAAALNNGESTYGLQEAQDMRYKIMKLYESIDALSKRILTLGTDAPEPPSSKKLALQRAVRGSASNFMQAHMMGLQSLPSEETVAKLQEARKQEVQRRIEAERKATLELQEKQNREEQQRKAEQSRRMSQGSSRNGPTDSSDKGEKDFVSKEGWIPFEVSQRMSSQTSEHPMVQQMNIIRGYIKQARQAQKWDEVMMLEDNLKELQQEYLRERQQQQKQQHAPGAPPR